ncbi:hypothetical protein BDR22DRAFT_888555 [Usnea florida]
MDNSKTATGLNAESKDTDLALQSGEEPISGEQGRGTVDEPFDAGNAEGSEGAPAKEGMTGVLGDAKKKAEELVGTKS